MIVLKSRIYYLANLNNFLAQLGIYMGFIFFLIFLFIAFVFLKKVIKNKVDLKSAREDLAYIDVENGIARYPSWIQNRSKVEEFYTILTTLCKSKGIPPSLLETFFKNEDTGEVLLRYAGALEARGSSFNDQAISVADRVKEMCRLT